jgi:fluoride ion exporter CrcB/FEX
MIRDSEHIAALGNVSANVVLGLVLVWAGYALTTSR